MLSVMPRQTYFELLPVDLHRELTHWGCGGKVGLLGGSSCIHKKISHVKCGLLFFLG